MQKLFVTALAAGLLAAGHAQADSSFLKATKTGNPEIQSIQAITFGPDGLLLIADGRGKQVVAIDTGDTKPIKWKQTKIANIDSKLDARLGVKGAKINKLAVNPASGRAYLACSVNKKDVLLTVDGNGMIKAFPLDSVKYAAVPLDSGSKLTSVTDIAWAGDRVFVAARANETFASKVFTIKAPLQGKSDCGCFSTETYHVAHRRWETKAPIQTVMPFEENGKRYVVGAFTCTPIVKYPLDEMKAGAKVKGMSVIELGSGNRPRDMFAYKKGGKQYILLSTYRFHHSRRPVGPSPYWTARVDYDLLSETKNVNKDALVRVDGKYRSVTKRAIVVPEYHGVTHVDKLDDMRAVVIRGGTNGLSLEVIALP